MRSILWVVSGLTCGGLWAGCGGESSSKHDAGVGAAARAAESGGAGASGGSTHAGAGGGAGAASQPGGAGKAGATNAGPTGGKAGAGGAGPIGGKAGAGGAGTGNVGGNGAAGALGDAGAPAAGETGTGGAHEIPTKDGLPIGDCTEPTAEELAALGCPAVLEYMAPCTQVGAVCRSEIRTNEPPSSSQAYATCQENGQLDAGALRTCGLTCEGSAGNDTTLDVADCDSRPVTECDTSFVTYPAPPLAQEQADHELQRVLQACGAPVIGNRIEVKLMNGCPYALSTSPTLSSAAVDCLKATLSDARWSCAKDLACVSWAMFFM